MKKRTLFYAIGAAVLLLLLTIESAIAYDNSKKVSFLDEEMGYVIAFQAYWDDVIEQVERFRQDDLGNIKELNIGYTGYYTTLLDLKKCHNLESLYVNAPVVGGCHYYYSSREVPKPESRERIEQLQKELSEILQICSKLKTLYIWNPDGICNLDSLEFLNEAKNLRLLWLEELKGVDYTPIWQCEQLIVLDISDCDIADMEGVSQLINLEGLYLDNTNISEAGDLLDLPNLKKLEIENTPLAENEEELALLYEAFPDIEIDK